MKLFEFEDNNGNWIALPPSNTAIVEYGGRIIVVALGVEDYSWTCSPRYTREELVDAVNEALNYQPVMMSVDKNPIDNGACYGGVSMLNGVPLTDNCSKDEH